MAREQEIALALSAAPPAVAARAGVYVLEKDGYVKVRDSQNGFVCLVDRRVPSAVEPQCPDEEGAKTFLPRFLLVAALRAQGKPEPEIRQAVRDAFAKGTLRGPARPWVNYMLSTQNVVTVDENNGIAAPFPPHFRVARGLSHRRHRRDSEGSRAQSHLGARGTVVARREPEGGRHEGI